MTKAEIKAAWLKELRSGEHKQAKDTLVEEFEDGSLGYCCLGILACKVLGIEEQPNSRDEYQEIEEGSDSVYKQTREILGDWKFTEDGRSYNRNANNYLTTLNDDLNWNFEQIADTIEKHWEVE